jgi:hypothetical protein
MSGFGEDENRLRRRVSLPMEVSVVLALLVWSGPLLTPAEACINEVHDARQERIARDRLERQRHQEQVEAASARAANEARRRAATVNAGVERATAARAVAAVAATQNRQLLAAAVFAAIAASIPILLGFGLQLREQARPIP